jgi:uncharacterized protein
VEALMSSQLPICIFAKPPVAGSVKTRLAEGERAARLARAFLLDTCTAVRRLPWARPILATTGPLPSALAARLDLPTWPQGGGDLGARIERVLRRALEDGPRAIAIGADTPGLPRALLEAARAALDDADAAIGPTSDGGFYVLALRRCPDGLLADLPWSREDTFAATLKRLRDRGLVTKVLEPWFDVDRPADLVRLHALISGGVIVAPETEYTLTAPTLSIVMPVLNEERRIGRALAELARTPGLHEIIVVDGGSTDRTRALAEQHHATVIAAPRGRGPQLNAGAAIATGQVLLFLHADVRLPRDAVAHVRDVLADNDVIAGAFRTWTTADDDDRPWFSPLLHLADLRSRVTRFPYGDQAMFVRSAAFHAAGGFRDVPIMEDLELSHRLWQHGRIVTCRGRVRVSGRRFVARPLSSLLAVNLFPLLYRAGVSPHTLARFYAHVR